MSEPSLRTTVASALAKADGYAPSDNPEAWRDNRLRYEQLADAALRVIHSQRDAIEDAIRERLNPKGATPGELADAVLATLTRGEADV